MYVPCMSAQAIQNFIDVDVRCSDALFLTVAVAFFCNAQYGVTLDVSGRGFQKTMYSSILYMITSTGTDGLVVIISSLRCLHPTE